jgi:hypothetical protein
MGGSHSHSHDASAEVPVANGAKVVLLTTLAVAAVLTLLGIVHLWPEGQPRPSEAAASFAVPG